MVEKLKNNNNLEQEKNLVSAELEKAAAERRSELERSLERSSAETGAEKNQAEKEARHEAFEQAEKAEEEQARQETANVAEKKQDRPLTKKDVEIRYKQTMNNIQSQLSAPSRAFSKVIHNPVVEKTSEAVGNTIARPNLVIAGALGAIASIIIYSIAKRYGYPISGSETIVLFALGWLAGAVVEYARVGFANKGRQLS